MIKLKVLATALVVTAAKAANKDMKALANAVTKNKTQRRVVLNEIDVIYQNSLVHAIYGNRLNHLGVVNPRHNRGSAFSRQLKNLCASHYEAAFSNELPYTAELEELIARFEEDLVKSSETDIENVKSIITDAVGGEDKVWVATVNGYHHSQSTIEVLSPNTDLESWVEEQTNPKPVEVEAGDLYNWLNDRDQFNKDHKKEGERCSYGHYCCNFYKNVETGEFITGAVLETLQGSKVKLVGYNQRYHDSGVFGEF